MDIYYYIAISIFLIVILCGIVLLLKFGKKKKLSLEKKAYFEKLLIKIDSGSENRQKIIDYDKLYHKILQELGYKGDFGSILKTFPKEVKNINKIWELHKFRNRLVHEFDSFSKELMKKTVKEYKKEIEKILT